MIKTTFATAAAVSLAGCVAARQPTTPLSLAAADVAEIQAAVRHELREPSSAQFMPPRAVRTERGTVVVCGAVNSRNAFGGMTDWQPYIGEFPPGQYPGRFRPYQVGGTPGQMNAALNTCEQFGIPADLAARR